MEHILCGNGAADLIYTYCAALRPRTAVELAPTFVEYGAGLAQVGCRVERYFLHQAQNFDLDERFLSFLEEKKPEVVFLCNPNNPTGRLIPLPREISAGCGLAWRMTPEDWEHWNSLLDPAAYDAVSQVEQ